MFETAEDDILNKFMHVKREAADKFPDLTLLYGGELYFTADILKKLENNEIPCMNDTRFALIEFSQMTPWKDIHLALSQVLMLGITPIVAYIECYAALEFNGDRVQELINMGCYTQVNSVHVLKAKLFGDKLKIFKKRTKYFLDKDLVHCISSDMHNLKKRLPYMKQAYQIVDKVYGARRPRKLFEENATSLINNEFYRRIYE